MTINRGSASMAVSSMVGIAQKTKKKLCNFVFLFVEAQEINLRGNLQGSK